MKLTNHEFTKLLSEQLSADEDNTSTQLAKMLSEFNKAGENGEEFIINGLGSFSLVGGSVQFHPSDEFSTEINHNYEGMEPVDVDAALVVDADEIKPSKSKKTVKKDVIIVDEGVEGEEDPFGIDSDEPSVLVRYKEDVYDKDDDELVEVEGESLDDPGEIDKADTKDIFEDVRNEVVSETDKSVNEVSDDFFDGSETITIDEESDIADEIDQNINDQTVEETDTLKSAEENEADDLESTTVSDFEEPLLNINTKSSGDLEDETEDIFDFIGVKLDDNPSVLENPSEEFDVEEIFDPIESVADTMVTINDTVTVEAQSEDPVTESEIQAGASAGPRIVKLSEHQKSQSNVMGILKLIGIAALLLVIVGGAWWAYVTYFDTLFGTSSNEPIVMSIGTPADTETDQVSQNDEDAIFQQGVSIPLGSADDDPAPEITPDLTVTKEIISPVTPDPAPAGVPTATVESSQSVPPTPREDTASDDVYGLMGSSREIQGNVFSIIVHSLPSQISANEECDKIVSSGLRCIVRVATRPDGRTTYRVGIGQFPSMDAAQEQAELLDEPFKSRNFVARVN